MCVGFARTDGDWFSVRPLSQNLAARHAGASTVALLLATGWFRADTQWRWGDDQDGSMLWAGSPLHAAAGLDKADVARVLLDAGANSGVALAGWGRGADTALDVAVRFCRREAACAILRHPGAHGSAATLSFFAREVALHEAAIRDDAAEVARLVAEEGALLDAQAKVRVPGGALEACAAVLSACVRVRFCFGRTATRPCTWRCAFGRWRRSRRCWSAARARTCGTATTARPSTTPRTSTRCTACARCCAARTANWAWTPATRRVFFVKRRDFFRLSLTSSARRRTSRRSAWR